MKLRQTDRYDKVLSVLEVLISTIVIDLCSRYKNYPILTSCSPVAKNVVSVTFKKDKTKSCIHISKNTSKYIKFTKYCTLKDHDVSYPHTRMHTHTHVCV